ncbi:hypothetical protein G6F70_002550 [Rhizopus microsporus]|nr:hypothetical protein G6F71_007262 [Rhizopus microsporus]KAG1202105.1 hypothetical protein G6F70_002550 [Rhizopus microsporus]KAG1226481.1 hypothetical protein G6F67_008963 [Rhizopus microsporus]KAG1261823.1 hypothetical protein G6F68_006397 [Rhizopus microsporus]
MSKQRVYATTILQRQQSAAHSEFIDQRRTPTLPMLKILQLFSVSKNSYPSGMSSATYTPVEKAILSGMLYQKLRCGNEVRNTLTT